MIVDLMQEWIACRDGMLAAIERTNGTHTEDDVLCMLIQGKLKLIREGSSGVVVEVLATPGMKILHVFLAGGEMAEVLKIEATLPTLARELGCKRMTLVGRHGWERALADKGWSDSTIYLQRDVL